MLVPSRNGHAAVGVSSSVWLVLIEDESFTGEDWYGEEMADRAYVRCTFSDVDLTEASTRGVRFEECQFFNVRFNASRHADSAFLRCAFRRCNLFQADFSGCKLVGSTFHDTSLRPLTVTGGDWSFVSLAGADLRTAVFRGVRMREADLSGANLKDAVLSNVDLSAAQLRNARLSGTDLRGSDLTGLDPRTCEIAGAIVDANQAVVLALALGVVVR
jgi:fluoroquinolone resistance protein